MNTNTMSPLRCLISTIALLPLLGTALPGRAASNPTFIPGAVWHDTTGKPINAHGGGMLYHNGVYYWYGEFKEGRTWAPEANKSWGGTRVVALGVSCYSSTNLYEWKFEGLALPAVTNDPAHDLHSTQVIERPKVIYNRATKKFVMWLHIDSENYAAAKSGVAVSDSPTGPFTYLGGFRPNAGIWPENITEADKQPGQDNPLARDFQGGQMARDMTLFVDDDGKAYHFYASEENPTMHVSLLTDDYLKPAGKYVRIFEGRSMEAPAVFKRNGKYYLIASGCTGWAPNAARAGVADSIFGPWTELENPWLGAEADTSYRSQSTFVQPVQGLPDTYLFMADRWNSTNLPDSRYIWLPLNFEPNGQPRIQWQDKWSLPARDTLSVMERVADWQIANKSRHKPTDWTMGAYYAGVMALAEVSASAKYRDAMIKMGEANQWKPGPRMYHADDQAVGQTYVELCFLTRDTNMIAPLRANFDKILAAPKTDSLKFAGEGDVWSWCDSLFMAPPAWLRLSIATGETKYREFAITNWWHTSDYLFDKEEHLYFRDSTFFPKREANGAKIFWSRGNGWVIAGLVRMLQHLSPNDPDRARFETQFKQMAEKILTLQQPDGLWRSSLLDAVSYPLKETSGSGFYCYALAWGVNNGLLDRARLDPAARRAWDALVSCVDEKGKLTHVQPIGADPKKFSPQASEVYGVGAFLLAGSEMLRLDGKAKTPERPLATTAASKKKTEAKHTFAIGPNDFLLDGKPFLIRCGEIHAPRVPPEYWRHRLQMAKAMGLNTVCAYLFWNLHEPRPGEFNWSYEADAAEFCRIAQEEGLWVILRPGPYACAEWEMGGTPWWLLKHDDIKLRSRDPRYLGAAKRYLAEVARVLGPLQITKGGPILMVQVENEYGFFGKDAEYMGELRQVFIDAGFDVPLFACNPKDALRNGYRADLFPVVNFGSDPAGAFKALRQILPEGKGPLMCGEFYPGWFDTWGAPHHTGKTDKYLADLEYMLKHNASFSIYMAHGGTTFGFWAGCDRPFKPDTSSYDYDAPISEAGWTTDKFFKTRDLFAKYLQPGETIPEPPAKNPVISFPPVTLSAVAPIFNNLPAPVTDEQPQAMEKYDQMFGCILYRTTIPGGPATTLEATAIKDFGFVFVDGQRIGVMDRRSGKAKLNLPARSKAAQLDILVEPMGRVNFGPEMKDPKGLIAPVKLGGEVLKGWQVFNLPFDQKMLAGVKFESEPSRRRGNESQTNQSETPHVVSYKETNPAIWRGTFEIETPGDTFLDLRNWGKGVVWVNGHCLARFWNIGPTQTAYLPGCWLKPGKNEIIIWDLIGPTKAELAGLATPILDQLRPELDFAKSRRPEVTLKLDGVAPTYTGTFSAGSELQEVKFTKFATGKFFCLESLNAHDNGPYAAIAELDLLGADGTPLSHNGWTVAYVDSEERVGEDGTAENAIDGQTANLWHTEWQNTKPNHPHRFILNLGSPQTVSGFRYVPRQSAGGGRIKDYRVFVGELVAPK